MPYIQLKLIEGRDIETKNKLVSNITEAVCDSLNVSKNDVRIELIELKKDLFSIGGELIAKKNK
ncbi:tautomerase family protein [Pseudogracilibacillus sp. SE30717A]|uniref:tautomerase family protein n=1 Tax=Pseudogracilibacillus sp. SE30717A TaxID=3098293 RepID=UPI00300E4BBB